MPKHPRNDTDGGGVPIFRNDHANDIVELLRQRACPPEGEYIEHDHGHSDCYLEREAADEIERLRSLITEWAYSGDERAIHLRSGDLTESIDKRHYDACEALVKAVGFPRLVRQESGKDSRRDLPA